MKFTQEIEINKPLEEVVALFDNTENLSKWMDGLQSFEHLSGTPGYPGAKSKLTFLTRGRKLEMIETITARNLPDHFDGMYEASGVTNLIRNTFQKVAENKTRYRTENEFRFKGVMKFFALLMPGAFKKQSYKYMEDFKRFAESV